MAMYDFGGYATKNDIVCSDGRRIRKNAFSENDGEKVPLVWQHRRDDVSNVLGHAVLENRDDGVYAYCKFNDTESGAIAKRLVEHGDVNSLSIYANKLVQKGPDVMHGVIREVSLVVAGANSGAKIDNLCVEHSDESLEVLEDEAIVYSDEKISLEIEHEEQNGGNNGMTAKEIFETLNDAQKEVVYAMLGYALSENDEEAEHGDWYDDDDYGFEHQEGGNIVKRNVFEGSSDTQANSLTHDEIQTILEDSQKTGSHSLRQNLQAAALEHGITNLDVLFPEAKAVSPTPEMIMRDQEWVSKVWNATRKSPFSRIKSMAADITEDEARAKGYIKGEKKVEEQFAMLKRVTTPQTVYKLQALDRDDIIDITDFNVVAWLKAEMRLMLNEELARAIMVGDGRSSASKDKINPQNIRPVYGDDEMYTIYHTVSKGTDDNESASAIVDAAHRARKNYKGSGAPTLYIGSDALTTLLLAKDKIGRRLYNTMTELASAMRVKEIVEVPILDTIARTDKSKTYSLIGLIVNLTDYVVGADKGGAVSMFDDFDIDYNKEKYLIETRCSGALVRPYSAIALEYDTTVTPPEPPVAG